MSSSGTPSATRANGNQRHGASVWDAVYSVPPRGRRPVEAASAPPGSVTARKPGSWLADAPDDLLAEEFQRRADAADELWRELVRRATGSMRAFPKRNRQGVTA